MISWKLWQALRWRRLRYTRYERLVIPYNKKSDQPGILMKITRNRFFLGIIGIIFIVFLCTISWVLIIPLLCLIPFVILGMGLISGVFMANQVAGLVSRTQTQSLYDTLSILPRGTLALDWAITAYVFQRSRILISIRDFLSKAAIVLLFGTFAIFAMGIVFATSAYGFSPDLIEESFHIFSGAVPFFIILSIVFIDLMHCTLIGSLVGMLIPTYVMDRMSASLLAVGTTLLLQIGYYAAVMAVFILVLPPIFRINGLKIGDDWYLSYFLVFYGGRELLIYCLWKLLIKRIDAEAPVIEELFRN